MNSAVEQAYVNWLIALPINADTYTGSSNSEIDPEELAVIVSVPTLETVVGPLKRATVEIVLGAPANHVSLADYRAKAQDILEALQVQNQTALAGELLMQAGYYFGGIWVQQSSESVSEGMWTHTIQLLNGLKGHADGTLGRNGLSAFEIAQINGYEGTEQDWLESLVGPEGPPGDGSDLGEFTAAQTLSGGRFVHISGSSVDYANAATSVPAMGYIDGAVSSGQTVSVLREGVLSGLVGLTLSTDYYLGINGQVTATPNTSSGIIQFIGRSISTTSLLVEIDSPIVIA